MRLVSVVTRTRSLRFSRRRISCNRSSTCPFTGRTSTSGSTSPVGRMICSTTTPGDEELRLSGGVVVEQSIRPTGLVDPEVEVRPVKGQVDDLLHEIRLREKKNERVLVTTLTKRMAEDL